MIGWRAKLGFLVPSANVVLEPELYKMVPNGVSAHFARIRMKLELTEEQLIGLADERMLKAAEELLDAQVDVVAFGCTTGSLIKGLGYDKEIIDKIENAVKIPTTTTSTAVVTALKEMGIRKVSVATAYEEWLDKKEKEFLEASGFEVVAIKGLGAVGPPGADPSKVPPERVYRLAKEVDVADADGVFISCTDFRSIEVLNALEDDLGKPVISSNQSTLWMALRMAGVRESIRGFGQLLTRV